MANQLFFQKEWLQVCCDQLIHAECINCDVFACLKCLTSYHRLHEWKEVNPRLFTYFLDMNSKSLCHLCGTKSCIPSHNKWLSLDIFKRVKINLKLAQKLSKQEYFQIADKKLNEIALFILNEVKKRNQKDKKFRGMLKAPKQGINYHNLAVLCDKVDILNTDILNYCYKYDILSKQESPNLYGLYDIGPSHPSTQIHLKQQQLQKLKREKEEYQMMYDKVLNKEETPTEFYESLKRCAPDDMGEGKDLTGCNSDSVEEPLPAQMEETKETGRAEVQFLALPKGTKICEEHSALHYKVRRESFLYIKKPNSLENTNTDLSHGHLCSKFKSGHLTLDVRKMCGRELLEEFTKKYYLPRLKELELNFLDKSDELVCKFLELCILHPMDQFHLNSRGLDKFQSKKKIPFTPYREITLKTIKNVKESLKLGYFHFNSDQISEIVRKCSHLTQFLEFENCKISVESDFNFGNCDTHIDVLCFKNTKFSSPQGIKKAAENLVKAISESTLEYSVKEIRRSGCNIGDTILEDCLKEHELDILVVSHK